MDFHSVLFDGTEYLPESETLEAPDYFTDLNLDQIVRSVTGGKQEYHLHPFFYQRLSDLDMIRYRQEIMQDLEQAPLFEQLKSFAQQLHHMRDEID